MSCLLCFVHLVFYFGVVEVFNLNALFSWLNKKIHTNIYCIYFLSACNCFNGYIYVNLKWALVVLLIFQNKKKTVNFINKCLIHYLGGAVYVIRIVFVTRSQSDVDDVLHWVSQSQQHLALLHRRKG